MKKHADFDWCQVVLEGKQHILIKDLDLGNVSVTNDAEAVIDYIRQFLILRGTSISDYQVFYRDSAGQWDQLQLDDQGRFAGFEPGPNDHQFDAAFRKGVK